MIAYAIPSDLATWIGATAPANAVQLLRSATIRVAKAANLSPYNAPAPDAAAPLRDATCAQATAWSVAGVDPTGGGLDTAPVKRSQILDATVELDTSGIIAAQSAMGCELCSEAEDILQQAGLLWLPTPLGDTTPYLPTYGLDSPPPWSVGAYAWPPLSEWPVWS